MEKPERREEMDFVEFIETPKTKDEFRRDGYKMERDKIGICYIVNNVDREQPATRRDVRRCEEVFTNLGFDVKLYLNQTRDEMRAIRNDEILNDETYVDYNCLVLVIIAHGSNKRNIFDVSGGTAWNLDVLEEQIARIRTLEGRPKLMFVEACRGQWQHNVAIPSNLESTPKEELVSFKTKTKGGVAATMDTSELLLPAKRDQFIGLSTVENYVAFTINTSGSPYLICLMRELSSGCFLKSLQAIHQITRQKVQNYPVHAHRYMVPDEHNRLHDDLYFRNYLLHPSRKGHLRKRGRVSYETPVSFMGVTYNIFEKGPDAHQVINSGDKILELADGLGLPFHFDLPKGSVIERVEEPPRTYMEVSKTLSECFVKATNHLINMETLWPVDTTAINHRLASTKPCIGFNVAGEGNGRHVISFHKEFPIYKISMKQEYQNMFVGISSKDTDSPTVFKTWIEKCSIPISIEDIHKDLSTQQDEFTKQNVIMFRQYWEHYFGKFGSIQKLKEVASKLPGIKESFSVGNSRKITKPFSIRFLLDCCDFFVILECPWDLQNGDMPDFTFVKLELLSKEEGQEQKEVYKQFLYYWGHHFITEFYQGGSIILKLLLTTEELKRSAKIKNDLNKICSGEDAKHTEQVFNPSSIIDIEFKGGYIEHQRSAFNEINAKQMKQWIKSLSKKPAPLMKKISVLPMYLAVNCLDPIRGEILKKVSQELQMEGKNWNCVTMKWPYGDETAEYTGEFQNGKPHGKGTLTTENKNTKYEGDFQKGKRSGNGYCYYNSQDLCYYSGEWVNDKPEGNGEGHYDKGDIYIGQWKNGIPEGLGTVYYKDGKEAVVLCENGFVEKVLEGEAIYHLCIGSSSDQHRIKIGNITYDQSKPLGDGGSAGVYRGTYKGLAAAVKKVNKLYLKDTKREETILSIIEGHENVVQCFGKEEDADFCYLALSLCKTDFAHVLKYPSKSNLDVITLLEEATKGLAFMHSKSKQKPAIAHRDVKPSNLLIYEDEDTGNQRAMVGDFGLSKKAKPDASYVSVQKSSGCGTRGWKSQELMKLEDRNVNDRKVDIRTDIFSSGCLFYYMLTNGKHPFQMDSETERHREINILDGKYNLDDLDDEKFPHSRSLIERMISSDPDRRPTAKEVLNDPMFKVKNRGLLMLGKIIVKNALGICCSIDGHACQFIQSFHSDIGATFFKSVDSIIGRDWVKAIEKCLAKGTVSYEDVVVVLSGTHGEVHSGTTGPTTALTDLRAAHKPFFDEDKAFVKKLKKTYPNHREIDLIDVATYHQRPGDLKDRVLQLKPHPKFIVFAFCQSNYCDDVKQLFARDKTHPTKLKENFATNFLKIFQRKK